MTSIDEKRTACRVCEGSLYHEPLIRFTDMPAMAQNFPDKNGLANDNGQDLEICQCSSCGLIQLNCQPVPYYKEVIRAAAFSDEMRGFRLDQFSNFVSAYKLKNKKILEVGCGKGEYLSLMHEQGVIAFGIEGSTTSVRETAEAPYIVRQDFIEKSDHILKDGPFDGFFILNYLEHLPNPNQSLRGIANNLADNAIGLIEVPNFDMIVKTGLFSEFISDHLFYFTKQTLTQLLQQNGFEVLECTAVWHDYCLSAVVKKRQPSDLSTLKKQQDVIQESVNNFIQRHPNKTTAIWGAGHQALANISLLKLSDHIKYVVDSAPFKQNKYTPASHLPIVSPQNLINDPVDAIIVMAASYSDEVAKIIRKDFTSELSVAILRDHGLEEV